MINYVKVGADNGTIGLYDSKHNIVLDKKRTNVLIKHTKDIFDISHDSSPGIRQLLLAYLDSIELKRVISIIENRDDPHRPQIIAYYEGK